MPSLGSWRFSVDRKATEAAYRQAGAGGADVCECAYCRNFRVAREQALPPTFLSLLRKLGIDSAKDAEVVQYCWDSESAAHWYGGWYHFVGNLEVGSDASPVEFGPHFSASLQQTAGEPKVLKNLADAELVHLEFFAKAVPWLLSEENPE